MNRSYERGVVHWIMIIIGVLIVLTLIGYFTTDRSSEKQSGTLPRRVQPDCGLIIDQPLPNTLITLPVQISGRLKSCGSSPITSNRGTVQLIDANGLPMGNEIYLPIVGNWVGQPTSFYASVSSHAKPTTSTGFLLFINRDKTGTILNSFQIPVLFSL